MLRSDWLVFSSWDWCISILAVSVCCSFGDPLSYGSPLVLFLDRGHPCFRNFYSTIPVDDARVKSYVNQLFDPACVPMRITINKLYFVPKWVVSGVACSETAEIWVRASRISRSAASFGRTRCDLNVVSDLKTARMPCCCRQRRSCSDRPFT